MKYLGGVVNDKDISTKKYVDDKQVSLTQAQYDQLSQAEKMNGTVYFITDGVPDTLVVNDTVPIGAIQAYGGATAPANWLICDGSAVSRTTYAELFDAIGTTYGSGDDSTTFNLPDLKGRTIVGVGESSATGHMNHTLGQSAGEETHTLVEGELPKLSGTMSNIVWANPYATGIISQSGANINLSTPGAGSSLGNIGRQINFGGDQPHNNMQPYVVTNYIIKAKDYERGVTPISGLIAADVGATDPSGDQSNVQAELDALQPKTVYSNPSVSDFIELNSGVQMSNVDVAISGKVITWRAIITCTISSFAQVTVGTLKSAYRPKVIAPIISIKGAGLIGIDGQVYISNHTNTNINYGNNWTATYVLP